MKIRQRYFYLIAIVCSIVLVIIDQWSKGLITSTMHVGDSFGVIDGLFSITYVRNTGAAFGMLAGAEEFIRASLFLFLPVAACLWIIYLIYINRKKKRVLDVAYFLILSGATGNLIDRFRLGFVVDFLDFHYKANHFPAFNTADSLITIAAFLLIFDSLPWDKIRVSFNKDK